MPRSDDDNEVEEIYTLLGRRLAAARRARGLTQEALSDRAAVSANYVARTEGGYHRANLAKLEVIAHALELSLGSLFAESPSELSRTKTVMPALLSELEALPRADQHLVLQLVRRMRRVDSVPYAAAAKRAQRKHKR